MVNTRNKPLAKNKRQASLLAIKIPMAIVVNMLVYHEDASEKTEEAHVGKKQRRGKTSWNDFSFPMADYQSLKIYQAFQIFLMLNSVSCFDLKQVLNQ